MSASSSHTRHRAAGHPMLAQPRQVVVGRRPMRWRYWADCLQWPARSWCVSTAVSVVYVGRRLSISNQTASTGLALRLWISERRLRAWAVGGPRRRRSFLTIFLPLDVRTSARVAENNRIRAERPIHLYSSVLVRSLARHCSAPSGIIRNDSAARPALFACQLDF